MIPHEWLQQAAARLENRIDRTPLIYDQDHDVYLKWENRQRTGSFKVRGAFNKVLTLEPWERQQGLVTASAGNHGQGVALAAQDAGAQAVVFASEHAVPAKLEAMQRLGADIRLVPGGYAEAEKAGLAYAADQHATWVSPYNDGQVIAGQGTLGLEILDQLAGEPALAWVVPAGGGGLLAGMGVSLQGFDPRPAIIGVQSEASAYLHQLYSSGRQEDVVEYDSLADGLAGMVEPGSITIPLVRQYVDGFVLVSEQEIAQAIAYAWYHYQEKIEGSAAVALAAVLSGKVAERPVVVVLTGGNIQPQLHAEICDRWRNNTYFEEAIV